MKKLTLDFTYFFDIEREINKSCEEKFGHVLSEL